MKEEFVYRRINPHDENDIQKYLKIQQKLDDYLHIKESGFDEERIKWLRIRMGATELLDNPEGRDKSYKDKLDSTPDEIGILCEHNGEVVGFSFVCTYHVVDGERPDDKTGIISEIYVDKAYRQGDMAFKLFQHSINALLEEGITSAIMTVQEDNSNRFWHFAIADKLIDKNECERRDGITTISYDLLISDLNRVKNLTQRQLIVKALKLKKQYEQCGLSEYDFESENE